MKKKKKSLYAYGSHKRKFSHGTIDPITVPTGMQVQPIAGTAMNTNIGDNTKMTSDAVFQPGATQPKKDYSFKWNSDLNAGVGTGLQVASGMIPQEGNRPSIGKAALSGAGTGWSAGGPWGAVIGAVVGAVSGSVKQKKWYDEEASQRQKEQQYERRQKNQYDKAVLSSYDTEGNTGVTYHYGYGGKRMYNQGGRVNPDTAQYFHGGTISPLSDDMVKATGAKHEQGGIDLPGNIEVEGGEVAARTPEGEVWYSDRLKTDDGNTFAEAAEKIAKIKAKSEVGVNAVSPYERGTSERSLQVADAKLNELEREQTIKRESIPSFSRGKRTAAFGTEFGKIATGILPYVDNIGNMALINQTPQLPMPNLYKPVPLETNVNINAELAEVEQQKRNVTRSLENYTTDPGILRANTIAAHAATIGAKNKIYQFKTNKETELRNRDAVNRQHIYNANVDQQNKYEGAKFARKIGIQERKSANLANMAEDAKFQIQESRLEKRDKLTHAYLQLRFRESGVGTRAINKSLDAFQNGEITESEFDRQWEEHSNSFRQAQYDKTKSVAENEKKRRADLKELDEIKKDIKRRRKLGKISPLENKTSKLADPNYLYNDLFN